MKNWEELYEKYKSVETEQRYNELKEKVEKNEIETKEVDGVDYVEKRELTKEEYKEFQSMRNFEKIKGNLIKVENVLEFRKELEKNLEELKVEEKRREVLKNEKELQNSLQAEILETIKKQQKLTQYLYDPNVSDAKKEDLKNRISVASIKIKDLEEKYETTIKAFNVEERLKTQFSNLSNEEIKSGMLKTSANISKCNIVGEALMEGRDWTEIDYRLDNMKEYTNKEKTTEQFKGKELQPEIKTKQQVEKEDVQKVQSQPEPAPEPEPIKPQAEPTKTQQPVKENTVFVPQPRVEKQPEPEPEQEQEEPRRTPEQKEEELAEQDFIHDIIKKKENTPAKVPDFLTRHPRIAKIINWLKNNPIARRKAEKEAIRENKENLKNVVDREKRLSQEERPKVVEAERARLIEEKDANDFKAYIRQIAEKGTEGVEKEQKEARKERLQPMKQAAYERESEKFGEEYAKKSYEPKTEQQNDANER